MFSWSPLWSIEAATRPQLSLGIARCCAALSEGGVPRHSAFRPITRDGVQAGYINKELGSSGMRSICPSSPKPTSTSIINKIIMRPNLVPIIAILAAQASSAFPNGTSLPFHYSPNFNALTCLLPVTPPSSPPTPSSLINQSYIWYSRALLHGGINLATANINGQEWIRLLL